MKLEDIIFREFTRIYLIVCFPIALPLWIYLVGKGNKKKAFFFYWKSIFKKDLNFKTL